MTVELFQPPAPKGWDGLHNISPFCLKLETYFKMAKVQYKPKMGDPRVAPKQRIPYIRVDGGELMGDSVLIIEKFERESASPLDAHLSAAEKAISYAFASMIDDHLYFALAYLRWNTPEAYSHLKKFFKVFLPPVAGGFIMGIIRKDIQKKIKQQGMGMHTEAEVTAFAKKSVLSLSDFLGSKKYFNGDKPTTLDATAYGFLANILYVPWEAEIKSYALSLPNLKSFCERIDSEFWK